jgi:hypothetical protein
MFRVPLLTAVLACVFATSGCGLIQKGLARKKKPVPTDNAQDAYIGVVESVNPEQRFVLLRTDMRMAVAPGTRLESHAASGSKASLTVTPERKGNFLSADITEGMPAAGDTVILPKPSNIPALNAPAPSSAAPVMLAPPLPVPPDSVPPTASPQPMLRLPQP